MIPREEAISLVRSFSIWNNGNCQILDSIAKQCALIAVDELIKQNGELYLIGVSDEKLLTHYRITNSFLFEVKQEIEKL